MVEYTTRRGKVITLLNPDEMKKKAKYELDHKIAVTNDYEVKLDKDGNEIVLGEKELAYRAGFRSGVINCQKCHYSKLAKGKAKKTKKAIK